MAKKKITLAEPRANIIVNSDVKLTPADFEHVGVNLEAGQQVVRESTTYFKDAWRRLKKNKAAMVGLAIIIFFVIMAVVGPMMTKYTYNTNDLSNVNLSPNGDHWFGTDQLGRDLWARVWMGARVSLAIGFFAAFLEMTLGIFMGGLAGMMGGKVDMLIMRAVDILNAIPALIFVILIMVIIGSGIVPLIAAFAITGWLSMARMVRGQILELREQEFVLAAITLGANKTRLLVKHMVPNIMSILVVQLTLAIPGAIFYEAFLSFIGIGIQPPMTSWGQLSKLGGEMMRVYPYQLIIPGTMISLAMLSLNLLGDGLRDSLDPRMRK